ncbi:unnamed protein product [Notodromas monacha]|uniref:Uncharacterized protein n=1 Tax=Notodromas monacha TaxID=399045 RepID=A0A7R9BSB4_9CRUS|nr:unnamed protein product [Notodromas monacha]CAG0919872.1 unnamed protein product [Notodromas monacha]
MAGAETTATTLRWTILYLISYPEVQAKLHQEIDKVVGKDRLPCQEDCNKMPYAEAVLWEIWRHVTVVPTAPGRLASQDIQLGGYIIPKVDSIFASQKS